MQNAPSQRVASSVLPAVPSTQCSGSEWPKCRRSWPDGKARTLVKEKIQPEKDMNFIFDAAGRDLTEKPRKLRKKDANFIFRPRQKRNQGAAAYQLGNTSSRTITEVKQR